MISYMAESIISAFIIGAVVGFVISLSVKKGGG